MCYKIKFVYYIPPGNYDYGRGYSRARTLQHMSTSIFNSVHEPMRAQIKSVIFLNISKWYLHPSNLKCLVVNSKHFLQCAVTPDRDLGCWYILSYNEHCQMLFINLGQKLTDQSVSYLPRGGKKIGQYLAYMPRLVIVSANSSIVPANSNIL